MSIESVVLAALQAAGGVCSIVCPACKALVDIGEELAKTALTPTTEQAQVQAAEDAIFAADDAVTAGLAAVHVVVAPPPVVQAVAAVVAAELPAAVGVLPVAPQAPGTVKAW